MCLVQIQPNFNSAEQKNKLMRSVAGGGVDQLTSLQSRWDKFELMMESHQLMVKEQVRGDFQNLKYTAVNLKKLISQKKWVGAVL